MRLGVLAGVLGLLAVCVLCIVGFALADLPGISACSGDVFDTDLCEAARLRQTIFAAALTASGVIAAAILVGALIRTMNTPSPRPHSDADPT